MKNKILLCVCSMALVAALFTSCKQDVDLYAIDSEIAEETMLGTYVWIEVDSAAMSTTLHEWNLSVERHEFNHDEPGRPQEDAYRYGYYAVAATGNGLDQDSTWTLTWSKPTMAEDKLSMAVPVQIDGRKEQVMTWQDGVLTMPEFRSEKSLISLAGTLRSVHEYFRDFVFEHVDSTFYITVKMDTAVYLAWKTAVVSYTQEQIDSAKLAMIEYADTLAWFNATYPDRAVPDTVRFSAKQQSDGTYKGQVSVPYEDNDIQEIKTNHGPLHIINSTMAFMRDDQTLKNTGYYIMHEETWTEECYTKPGTKNAKHVDSYYAVTDALWTPVYFINVKKFDVMLKGKMDMVITTEEAGGAPQTDEEHKLVDYHTLQLSGFNRADGEVTCNELKYKKTN